MRVYPYKVGKRPAACYRSVRSYIRCNKVYIRNRYLNLKRVVMFLIICLSELIKCITDIRPHDWRPVRLTRVLYESYAGIAARKKSYGSEIVTRVGFLQFYTVYTSSKMKNINI